MGNSREEDRKILEKLINTMKSDRELFDEKTDKEIYTFFINALEHILSDYKRVLKENEELKIKNNAIKRESEAYAEDMIRLDNELNLEKEKSKYEWIRQNCLSQELVNKLYIPIQKVKDKMEYLDNQQKQWLEDRELKENDSEIIFARDILKELLGKE